MPLSGGVAAFARRVRELPASLDAFFVGLLAAVSAIYWHWPALTNPLRFDNNWRQAPHWISPERASFQPDDPLVRFAEFGTSQVADLIYKTLALTGHDIVWGKINAILFFVAFIVVAFLVGRAMGGRRMGWISALLLLFAPSVFIEFGGGFMDALSAPLLGLAILVIVTEGWKWSVPLAALQALQYPMVGLHSGMIYLVDALMHDGRKWLDLRRWRRKYLVLGLAALAMGLIIALKYLGDHPFGELATRATMGDRPEFAPGARSRLLPVRPLFELVENRLFDGFHLVLFLFAFAQLGKRALRLPRGLTGLLVGSLVMYVLADVFLFRLYFPNRYVHFSFPLFLALAGGYWIDALLTQARERVLPEGAHSLTRWRSIAIVGAVLLVLAVRDYDSSWRPGRATLEFRDTGLYAWVGELPGRPLIALHPEEASAIPVITGKSVFIMFELSQPYWSAHWELVERRTKDFFRAYFAEDPQTIIDFTRENGIDYWVVQPAHYEASYLEGDHLLAYRPFGEWIRDELSPTPDAVLAGLDAGVADYVDGDHLGISSEALIQWLETR